MRRAFTLIELLVVIAIIAILSVVVILTLNPAELLRQSRDSNRVSDMSTLNSAINLYSTDQSATVTFNMGSSSVVYVSIPDPTATITGSNCSSLGLPSLPTGYSYHCAASSTFRNADGTGWIPVNLKAISSGAPLGSLPVDPINTTSSRLYYTYTTNGTQFELTGAMESAKYKLGGKGDVISSDGGVLATTYEKGSKLGLEPLDYGDPSLVAYYPFDEGSGTVAYDQSGNNATGTYVGVSWVQGKVGPYAVSVGNSSYTQNGYVTFGTTLPSSTFTLSFWADPTGINPNVSGYYNTIIAGDNYSINGFRSGFDSGNGGYDFWTTQDGGSISLVGGSYTIGKWDMWTVTYSNGTALLYEDGVLKSTSTGTYINGGMPMAVDANVGGVYWFWGSVDDVRIYSRALSASEIANIYNAGK